MTDIMSGDRSAYTSPLICVRVPKAVRVVYGWGQTAEIIWKYCSRTMRYEY